MTAMVRSFLIDDDQGSATPESIIISTPLGYAKANSTNS